MDLPQQVELPSISNSSNARQQDPIENNDNEGLPLNQNNGEARPFSISRSLCYKIMSIVALGLFLYLVGHYLLSQDLLRKRTPSSLSSLSWKKAEEVVSPQEKDYRAFLWYNSLVEDAKGLSGEGKSPESSDVVGYEGISFDEFYNLFKVIKTIQLAKEFEFIEGVEIIDESKELNQPINQTEFFPDAVDQFRCASCYSFPITATIQYLYKKKYNITVKLSEQQLIDCVHEDPTANGCEDGDIKKGFEYVQRVGLVTADNYPYLSVAGTSFQCRQALIDDTEIPKYKISGFRELPTGNCTSIQVELLHGYTVASMINAENMGQYQSGQVFSDCKRNGLNHAVTVVGQTEVNSWIVRNSWGKSWGDNGYLVMGHGNTCGICLHSIVPQLYMNEKGQVIPFEEVKKIQKTDK